MLLRSSLLLTMLACVPLAGCDFKGDLEVIPEVIEVFSFEGGGEGGMDGWVARGADLAEPPVGWQVLSATEEPTEGERALRFRVSNEGGQGRVWIERRWELVPDQEYEVRIVFDLVTADHGDVGPWRILAGAGPEPPSGTADLASPFDTGVDPEPGAEGFQSVEHTVIVQTASDEDGELFLYLGLRGTSPLTRTYYLDHVRVEIWRRGLSAPTGPTVVF